MRERQVPAGHRVSGCLRLRLQYRSSIHPALIFREAAYYLELLLSHPFRSFSRVLQPEQPRLRASRRILVYSLQTYRPNSQCSFPEKKLGHPPPRLAKQYAFVGQRL